MCTCLIYGVMVYMYTFLHNYTCTCTCKPKSIPAIPFSHTLFLVVIPIFFFSYVDALVLYLQKVGEAAPNTPMYYYHIPDITGVRLPMTELVERASTDIPTLRGLKYTDKDLMQLSRIAECERGKYNLMYGSDEVRNTPFLFNVQIINDSLYPVCTVQVKENHPYTLN